MAKSQIQIELDAVAEKVTELEKEAIRTGMISDRVMVELVPAMNKLTEAVSRLFTKVAVQGTKLYLLVGIVAFVAAGAGNLLVKLLVK